MSRFSERYPDRPFTLGAYFEQMGGDAHVLIFDDIGPSRGMPVLDQTTSPAPNPSQHTLTPSPGADDARSGPSGAPCTALPQARPDRAPAPGLIAQQGG